MPELEKEQHLQDGTILNNRYKILRFLSSGGFGNTYEAEDEEFGAHVAIKELFISGICKRDNDDRQVSISVADNRQLFRRHKEKFRNEAARLRKINHPNVVKVRDEFEENGTAYYVMDFVRGKSLDDMQRSGELNEKRSVQYINQVLAALEAVHNVGILHLDIKPSNVMVDDNNSVVLIDFGASKRVADDDGKSLSLSTGLAGTPGYAPLEQMSGDEKLIKEHSDIYAVGATLYKLVSGLTPPDSNGILNKGLPDIEASPLIKTAIKAAMEVKCANRPQTVAEFRAILNGGGSGGVVTPPAPEPQPAPKPTPGGTISIEEARERERRRRRRMMLVGTLIGVFILAGVVTWFLMNNDIFGSDDIDSSSSVVDTAQVQEVAGVDVSDVPVVSPAPVVDVVEPAAGEDVDDGYSAAYADALNMYNSGRYAECKSRCQKLLRQYSDAGQRRQLNQLIDYCDTAIERESAAELERQYKSDYASAEGLYNQKKYSECKSKCQGMLSVYPDHRGEINALIGKCDSAISAAEQAAAASRLPDKAVDLGLSVYWADRNVGAEDSRLYGDMYTFDDASSAARSMGSGWRMPTKAELEELNNKCTWSWTGDGYRVTGSNGNSIYFPTEGYWDGDTWSNFGSVGIYWSSTPYDNTQAYVLMFGDTAHFIDTLKTKNRRFSVRPVRSK